MLGLLGTVAGAAALEIKRLHKRGSIEELRETKQRERELRRQLEVRHPVSADAKGCMLR